MTFNLMILGGPYFWRTCSEGGQSPLSPLRNGAPWRLTLLYGRTDAHFLPKTFVIYRPDRMNNGLQEYSCVYTLNPILSRVGLPKKNLVAVETDVLTNELQTFITSVKNKVHTLPRNLLEKGYFHYSIFKNLNISQV